MTHTGPDYGEAGRLVDKDYIGGTSTFDNLRHKGPGFPLSVTWTDRFNGKHKVVLKGTDEEITVFFPCGGKEINWHHGGGKDRTGFDVLCTWCEVKFWHIDADWINNHGIRIHFRGYSDARTGSRDVDWDRVMKGVGVGKTVAESIKDLSEAGKNVSEAGLNAAKAAAMGV